MTTKLNEFNQKLTFEDNTYIFHCTFIEVAKNSHIFRKKKTEEN